jgi:hypothetical protein
VPYESKIQASTDEYTCLSSVCSDLNPSNRDRQSIIRDGAWLKEHWTKIRGYVSLVLADFNRSGQQSGKDMSDITFNSPEEQARWVYHSTSHSRKFPSVDCYSFYLFELNDMHFLGKEMERGTGGDNSVMGATEGCMSSLSFSVPILADIQEFYLIVYFVQTILGHKSANEIRKKKRAKKQKVSSSIESSSHLIAQAINDGNQLELWKFLYEKGPLEGRLQAVAELLKFPRKPAPPIDSETEYNSDDQSSNGGEPPRRTSTSSSMNSSLPRTVFWLGLWHLTAAIGCQSCLNPSSFLFKCPEHAPWWTKS